MLHGKQLGKRKSIKVQYPDLGGTDTMSDPGACPPQNFTSLINVRIHGPFIIDRGGQSKLNSTPITGTLGCEGFFDASDIGVPNPQPV